MVLTLSLVAGTSGTASAEVSGASAFSALKGLAGTWEGKDPSGTPVIVEYRILVHGTTVMETQSPSTAEEMVTVYSLSGPDLILTHYCPMGNQGNQPHMALDRVTSTASDLRFHFVSLTNLDASTEMHVHAGRLVLRDAQHLHREWDIFMDGKHSSTSAFDLTRKATAH
jgi:hypothetical protein